ncbi:MAG: hypothetical protein RSD95_15470, partial [Clostridia bacterium]
MPSGKRLDVAGTRYDLQCPVAVGALRLDDVYTDFSRRSARIFYRGLDFFLELRFSKDFSHMVVFTPEG